MWLPPEQFRMKNEEFAGSDETGIQVEQSSEGNELELNRFSVAEK